MELTALQTVNVSKDDTFAYTVIYNVYDINVSIVGLFFLLQFLTLWYVFSIYHRTQDMQEKIVEEWPALKELGSAMSKVLFSLNEKLEQKKTELREGKFKDNV